MERSPICPTCLSKHENIPGMLYADKQVVGTRCDDIWHRGAEYNPNRWNLSEFDREFLDEQRISQR
jgi:hypothetical protein